MPKLCRYHLGLYHATAVFVENEPERFIARDECLVVYEIRQPLVDPRRFCQDDILLLRVFQKIHARETARRLTWMAGWRHLPDEADFPTSLRSSTLAAYAAQVSHRRHIPNLLR